MHNLTTNAQTSEMSRLIWMKTEWKCVFMKVRYFSEFFSYFPKVFPVSARGLRKISMRANVPAY